MEGDGGKRGKDAQFDENEVEFSGSEGDSDPSDEDEERHPEIKARSVELKKFHKTFPDVNDLEGTIDPQTPNMQDFMALSAENKERVKRMKKVRMTKRKAEDMAKRSLRAPQIYEAVREVLTTVKDPSKLPASDQRRKMNLSMATWFGLRGTALPDANPNNFVYNFEFQMLEAEAEAAQMR